MQKKIKIGLTLLVIGITTMISGLWILINQPNSDQLIQREKIICSDFSFEMSVGDEEGPPTNTEEQKRLCENRLRNSEKYKDFDRGCKFIKASPIEEEFKSDNFVSGWKWTCHFDCCVQDKEYCDKDSDCYWVCGCGCINKNTECETPEGLMYDCSSIMEEDYSCVCENNQCETIEK